MNDELTHSKKQKCLLRWDSTPGPRRGRKRPYVLTYRQFFNAWKYHRSTHLLAARRQVSTQTMQDNGSIKNQASVNICWIMATKPGWFLTVHFLQGTNPPPQYPVQAHVSVSILITQVALLKMGAPLCTENKGTGEAMVWKTVNTSTRGNQPGRTCHIFLVARLKKITHADISGVINIGCWIMFDVTSSLPSRTVVSSQFFPLLNSASWSLR